MIAYLVAQLGATVCGLTAGVLAMITWHVAREAKRL